MAGKAGEGVLEGSGTRARFESRRRIESDQASIVQNGDAIGEKFNFRKSVRGKEKRGALPAQNFGFEKATKIGGGEGIEAARGFVEKKDLRPMK